VQRGDQVGVAGSEPGDELLNLDRGFCFEHSATRK
jgi:hypothetical protein